MSQHQESLGTLSMEMCCRSNELPRQLRDRSDFAFLKASQCHVSQHQESLGTLLSMEMCCRSNVQLRQLRDRSDFAFLKASQAA